MVKKLQAEVLLYSDNLYICSMVDQTQTDLILKIDSALEEIRPHLAVDGGNIELVEVTEDLVVKLKWLGNCEFCSMSTMTMRAGVEQAIKSKVPEIKAVIATNGLS
jgi:Fe-S cluster biogenesis protein NfuA